MTRAARPRARADAYPASLSHLPYRGIFGQARPAALDALPLPPGPMPSHWQGRSLKAWRYVGVFGPELMLCVALVRIGRARQGFWALWDRADRVLVERTRLGSGGIHLPACEIRIEDAGTRVHLRLAEGPGVETICRSGDAYAWTRKQGSVPVMGTVELAGRRREIGEARAVIDDTSAYYERHTRWQWSAGAGWADDGRRVAWNLVSGVNDPPCSSERTVWLDGAAHEVGPCRFEPDLSAVAELRFSSEAIRERRDNFLITRSSYRQPFGSFVGRLPGGGTLPEGIGLAEAYGVMEEHDAWW